MTLNSQGLKLIGTLYFPERADTGAVPGVVAGPGWGGTKEGGLAKMATQLSLAGFAVLAFDFRGYGESEGARNRLHPLEQTADLRSAVAFMRGCEGIDPDRIAVLGVLTSAAAALQAASEDLDIKAVVGFFPFGDGAEWMRSMRSPWEWRDFLKRLETDRINRSKSGETALVDPNEILPRDPEGALREERTRASSQRRRDWKLGLESADAIVAFKPEDHVYRIPPRAVMLVAVEEDTMMPFEEVLRLYTKLSDPKRLLVLREIRHHDIYEPKFMPTVMADVAKFLKEVMV